jgi:hypothetical protein
MPLGQHEKTIATTWAGRMAGLTAGLGIAAKMPPPVGEICGAFAAGTGACAALAGYYANDPPDFDFERAAVSGPGPVPTDALRRGFAQHSELFEIADALNDTYSSAAAALRAYERAQGATLRRNASMRTARVTEAREHARDGAEAGTRLVSALPLLPQGLRAVEERPTQLSDATRPRSAGELPESTLSFLYGAGVPIGALRRAIKTGSQAKQVFIPFDEDAVRQVADSTREFSQMLAEWEPSETLPTTAA